jgi:hypothetical protein
MSAAGVAGRANQSNQGAERVAIGIRLTPGTMPGLLHSLGYTIRLLLKSPGFTVTAILIIGFGIGVNAAIFSLIDSVRLQPLPFPQANRLVKIDMPHGNASGGGLDYLDYLDIRAAQRSFDSVCVSHGDFLDLRGPANICRARARPMGPLTILTILIMQLRNTG